MGKAGKKPTDAKADAKADAKDEIIGQIIINLYEDSFEVKCTETVDFFTIYAVSAGIMEYLENVAEDLDKVDKIMIQ